MTHVVMNYLYRGKEKERVISVAEWHQLLVGDKYKTAVGRLRNAVALCSGRREGRIDSVLALPDIRMGEADGCPGLLVVTLAVEAGTPWVHLRKALAQLPQVLLAFRGSSGRTLKVVCQATLPDGRLPTADRDVRLFGQHALAMAAHYLEGQTGVRAVIGDGGRRCRMSHDSEAFLNEHAVPFVLEQPTEPLAMSIRRRTAALSLLPADRLPGYDDRHMLMLRFQCCYGDVVSRDYPEVDILLEELARQCMKNGLEAEFCLQRLRHMHLFRDYEVLARRVFRNVYGMCYQRPQLLEAKANAVPYYTLQVEMLKHFMQSRYLLRRNIVTDSVEYVQRGTMVAQWQSFDRHVAATASMEALSEGIEAWEKDVRRYVDSTWVADYDPVAEFLGTLPRWDGTDRVTALAHRVPTDNEWWPHDLQVWLRAMVAQWLGLNRQYGNAMVPLLIGRQGDGKSTFCRLLLPDALADYYTDRVDFANRNAAERMLTRFCLINIDEYDSLSTRQNAFLKHVLQKADVQTRQLYDTQIQNRRRYATFIGTTNDSTPLTDITGSRRFLCIRTTGRIDTLTPVNHLQLYAQVLAEVRSGEPAFFTKSDEQRIQRQNALFQQFDALAECFFGLYRLPQAGDEVQQLSAIQLLTRIRKQHAGVRIDDSTVKRLSRLLLSRGFPHKHTRTQNVFGVVPL